MARSIKLENDCLDILIYSSKRRGGWVSLREISKERNIPPSTLRKIFYISKMGCYMKYDDEKCEIFGDVLDKIAKKYSFDFRLKKMRNEHGRLTWHISSVETLYNSN